MYIFCKIIVKIFDTFKIEDFVLFFKNEGFCDCCCGSVYVFVSYFFVWWLLSFVSNNSFVHCIFLILLIIFDLQSVDKLIGKFSILNNLENFAVYRNLKLLCFVCMEHFF